MERGSTETGWLQTFRRHDKIKSGQINAPAFEAAIRESGARLSRAEIQVVLKYHSNSDGMLDYNSLALKVGNPRNVDTAHRKWAFGCRSAEPPAICVEQAVVGPAPQLRRNHFGKLVQKPLRSVSWIDPHSGGAPGLYGSFVSPMPVMNAHAVKNHIALTSTNGATSMPPHLVTASVPTLRTSGRDSSRGKLSSRESALAPKLSSRDSFGGRDSLGPGSSRSVRLAFVARRLALGAAKSNSY